MEQSRQPEDVPPPDFAESSRRGDVHRHDRSNEGIFQDDPVLQSNHKIFLSHSGYQKDFVEELCGDLEKCYRFPFFDRRPSSLPKGERFPELILEAARQCQMAVVVVSEEYFTSKWPMIELNAFVQSRQVQEESKSNTKLKILPLFYGLSLEKFGNEARRAGWFSKWEDLAKGDQRIHTNEWKKCLKVLASFNGIEYHRDTRAVKAYREEIVKQICSSVPSDIKWDDSHVQGGSTLCQAIEIEISQDQPSNQYGVRVMGMYGVGGLGKTTSCKVLCNMCCQGCKGKVSHVELGSQKSSREILKEALKDLTNVNQDLLQQLNEDQSWNVLREETCKQKTFLAIDNVWPNFKSIKEAKKYLQVGFHRDSVVLVTSRALETLTHCLGIGKSECFEVPSLEYKDAEDLFLHHAAYGLQFSNYGDQHAIEECVRRCYFCKGGNKDGHYLPLALKALGVQLGCVGKSPIEWVKALPKVRNFNYLEEEENQVFSILRSSFDCLKPKYKLLFMDLIVYKPSARSYFNETIVGLMEWLGLVHKMDLQGIEDMLQYLKARGLVGDVDMTSQSVYVHDLYREFAELECSGKLNGMAGFEKRKWVSCDHMDVSDLELEPSHSCWQNLIRLRICDSSKIESLDGVNWRYFSNVMVLTLGLPGAVQVDLDLKDLKNLRSLELNGTGPRKTIKGLQDLKNLTYFRCAAVLVRGGVVKLQGQLPASLEGVVLYGTDLMRPDVFARCHNLTKLLLCLCDGKLDLRSCTSLLDLKISSCDFNEVPGLGCLGQLRELTWTLHRDLFGSALKLPRLSGLEHLEVIDLSCNMGWGSLEGALGDLPALRCLNLRDCQRLRRLPDLSGLRNLVELDLAGSAIELREEDMSMLASLPLLQQVRVGRHMHVVNIISDVLRRKLRINSPMADMLELEREGSRHASDKRTRRFY